MEERKVPRFLVVFAVILALAGLVYLLRRPLVPVGVALFFAYLFDPVVDRLEARRLNRTAAIFVLAALALFMMAGGGVLVGFRVQRELTSLYHELPSYLDRVQETAIPFLEKRLNVDLPASLEELVAEFKRQAGNLDPASLKPLSSLLARATRSTLSLVSSLLGLIIVPVFLFYFLRDWDAMKFRVLEYLPVPYQAYAEAKARQVDEILGAFMRGQLTVCLVLGVLYSLGLMLTGIDLAVVIGMFSGLLFIVPYLGTILGAAAATVMALLKFGLSLKVLGVWAVFAAVQALEGTVITPRVMGEKVGLSPVAVIFSLLAGAELLGLLGMLLAVPVAAVLKVFIQEALERYRSSDFYRGPAAGEEKEEG